MVSAHRLRVLITPSLCSSRWWDLNTKYWSVYVGFLYFVILRLLSSLMCTAESRNGSSDIFQCELDVIVHIYMFCEDFQFPCSDFNTGVNILELRSGPENQARLDPSLCTLCLSPAWPNNWQYFCFLLASWGVMPYMQVTLSSWGQVTCKTTQWHKCKQQWREKRAECFLAGNTAIILSY